jgi:UDP:flavonoid glycosyltransferase YjiC (YdhE family)
MSEPSSYHVHRLFRERLARMRAGEADLAIDDDAILAVGLLVGAGFPYAAAAVAYHAEATERPNGWPWEGQP